MVTNGLIMRMHVVVVCSVVGTLGLVIVILGVAGEAATAQALVRIRPEFDINGESSKCVYQTTPALGCGILAALLALTSQIVVTATSLCCGCCRKWEVPTDTKRIIGIVLSAVSWYSHVYISPLHTLLLRNNVYIHGTCTFTGIHNYFECISNTSRFISF